MASRPTFRFLDLSPEFRNKVYSLLLEYETAIHISEAKVGSADLPCKSDQEKRLERAGKSHWSHH